MCVSYLTILLIVLCTIIFFYSIRNRQYIDRWGSNHQLQGATSLVPEGRKGTQTPSPPPPKH